MQMNPEGMAMQCSEAKILTAKKMQCTSQNIMREQSSIGNWNKLKQGKIEINTDGNNPENSKAYIKV